MVIEQKLRFGIQPWDVVEGAETSVACCFLAQFVFNNQQAIILSDALTAGRCTGFDLSGIRCHHQVSDRRILRLA